MANNTLAKNISQAVNDFADIKDAIIEKGVNVPGGTPTAEYDDLIRQIADVDLSNVVKFNEVRDVDLSKDGRLIMGMHNPIYGKVADNSYVNIALFKNNDGNSIRDVPMGYDFSGKTVVFTNTDLLTQTDQGGSIEGMRIFLQFITNGDIIFRIDGIDHKIYEAATNTWLLTEFTFPQATEQNAYVVTYNDLKQVAFTGGFSLDYVRTGGTGHQITLGSRSAHTQIESSEQPTWGDKTLATLDDITNAGANSVEVFNVDYSLITGFEVYDTMDPAEWIRLRNAIANNKIIVFIYNNNAGETGRSIATYAGINNDNPNVEFLRLIVVHPLKRTAYTEINVGNNNYQRWFYMYDYGTGNFGLHNGLNWNQPGTQALDASQGPNLMTLNSQQNINILKTFSVLPQSANTPVADTEFTNKKYVDSLQSKHKNVTLSGSWVQSGSFWKYTISDSDIKDYNTVIFRPDRNSEDAFMDAGVYSSGDVNTGELIIYSRENPPAGSISINYSIVS